jgi:chaperonin GroES
MPLTIAQVKAPRGKAIVELLKPEEVSKGGILLPVNKERGHRALVHVVGAGALLDDGTEKPVEVKPGDIAILNEFACAQIALEGLGDRGLVIAMDDILAVQEG